MLLSHMQNIKILSAKPKQVVKATTTSLRPIVPIKLEGRINAVSMLQIFFSFCKLYSQTTKLTVGC